MPKSITSNYNKIPLFKGMNCEEIDDIIKKIHGLVRCFPKSEYIFLAGDCVESLCVVLKGTVQMIKEDVLGEKSIIASLKEGEVFAENSLGVADSQSTVSYFAVSDSEILMLPLGRTLFDNGLQGPAGGRMMCNIISVLADNNAKLIEKTEILCKKTLRGKIMAYFEQEAKHQGSRKFVCPFNRTDLASYLDANRSALTRELSRMRDDGLVDFDKNVFELK